MSKLTALHINIIGIVVSLILSAALYFLLIKPKNELLETTTSETASVQGSGGTESAVKGKKTELKKTQEDAKKTEADWQVSNRVYMPTLNFGTDNNVLNLWQNNAYVDANGEKFGVRDMPVVWGLWLKEWYNAQSPGTMFIQANQKPYMFIPSFPTDPNQINQLKSLTFPEPNKSWRVVVLCTSFDNAMKHLEQFNKMKNHGMPVISNVAMAGHSPTLFMGYDLALYVIPPHDPPAADALINGAAAGDANAPNASSLGSPYGGAPGGPPRPLGPSR